MLDPEPALKYARELSELSQQHHLDLWLAVATGVEGWAMAALGDAAGLQKTATALSLARMAMAATEPTFWALHVGALHALGHEAECAAQAAEALKACDQHLDYYFAPALWCLRGEALSRLPEQQALALSCLQQALALASAQGARTQELHAARALLQSTRSLQERKALEVRMQRILADCPELNPF